MDIKNICTRIGQNSRIFLIGDNFQIDNPKLTHFTNGLDHVIDKMKGNKLFATIVLDKTVRSELAQVCVDLL